MPKDSRPRVKLTNSEVGDLRKKHDRLVTAMFLAEEALDYYASEHTHKGQIMGYEWVSSVELDNGATAREALCQIEDIRGRD